MRYYIHSRPYYIRGQMADGYFDMIDWMDSMTTIAFFAFMFELEVDDSNANVVVGKRSLDFDDDIELILPKIRKLDDSPINEDNTDDNSSEGDLVIDLDACSEASNEDKVDENVSEEDDEEIDVVGLSEDSEEEIDVVGIDDLDQGDIIAELANNQKLSSTDAKEMVKIDINCHKDEEEKQK